MDYLIRICLLFCLQFSFFYPQTFAIVCSQDQSSALLQFKQLFSFRNTSSICDDFAKYSKIYIIDSPPYCDESCSYPETMSWKEDTDCCSWNGVTCDIVTGHVIGLDLSCGWLHGSILSNSSLFLLRHLQRLNLAFNDFKLCQISSKFGQFHSLTHLNLSHSNFSGSIPSQIFYLSKLVSLDLSTEYKTDGYFLAMPKSVFDGLAQNLTELTDLVLDEVDMSTILPSSFKNLSSSLTSLSLKDCGLRGNFPYNIFHLPNLKVLNLAHNFKSTSTLPKVNWSRPLEFLDVSGMRLSGEFFDSIGNLMFLRYLKLSYCTLFGSVPNSLGNLTQLTVLSLSHNNFAGPVPSFLSKLKLLNWLDLGSNNFVGGFPDIFVNLTQLCHLNLGSNQLAGPFPSNGSEFRNLVYIDLFNNSFNGSLPSWLLTLPSLEYIDLGYNQLTGGLKDGFQSNSLRIIYLDYNRLHGPVPSSIFELLNLTTLYLSSNNLSGIALSMFTKLKKLEYLDLHSSMIQGPLPVPPPYLRLFLLSNNNLTGEIPLSVCSMSTIEVIDFSNNSLSGTIPDCIGNLSSLHVLDLRKNRFYGNIPSTFARGNHLRTLNFNNNELKGPIPQSLINCTMLEVLDLGNNKINDSFPHWLESLPQLQVLVLRSNKFYGPIQGSTRHSNAFPMLRIFDISNNNFSTFLPSMYFENLRAMMNLDKADRNLNYMGETYYQDSVVIVVKGFQIKLEKIITTFTAIDFSNNKFHGEIPESIGKLHSLRLLNLSQNNLRGNIPLSLEYLTTLESLDLSSNKLVGEIPLQLTSLTFLAILNLSQNQLEGPIPRGNQFDTFKSDSYNGNLELCGFPLSNKCDVDEVTIQFHDEDHSISSYFNWKVIMMGYGCGLMFGWFIGCTIFSTGKPQWFLRMIDEAIQNCWSRR